MRFKAAHKLVSYLLVLAALLMLQGCDVLSLPWSVGVFASVLASWPVDSDGPGAWLAHRVDAAGFVLRAALLAFVAWSLWKVWRSLADPDITPVVHLAVVLLIYKLFHRRSNRDYLQIYILSLLVVLTAAALAQSMFFAVEFAAFTLLGTWTLILFHLRREMEDNYLVKHTAAGSSHKVGIERILNSRRVVGARFFMATAITGVSVFLGAALTFALVPRIGAGFLLGRAQRGKIMVGFSDDVMLGRHGIISPDNQSVVLRAAVPALSAMTDDGERERAIAGLYWRGTVYDAYYQGHWLRSQRPDTATVLQPRGNVTLVSGNERGPRTPAAILLAKAWRQEIDIFGAAAMVAFALDRPLGYEVPAPRTGSLVHLQLAPRWSGEVGLRMARLFQSSTAGSPEPRSMAGAHYVAFSQPAQDDLGEGRGSGTGGSDEEDRSLRPYLVLPQSLSSRVRELALRLTANQPTTAGRIGAIRAWLQSTHRYTTDLKRDESVSDPLEDFLFHQDAGHCEYFASATVVLLRAAGIPSRYVNGFLGGEWNAMGQHVTVRDSRAHSWAEAYIAGQGWSRVDMTPGTATSVIHMSRLRQLVDSMELAWNRWVVEYDLSRQVDVARKLGRQLGMSGNAPRRQAAQSPTKVNWRRAWPLGAAFVLFLVGRQLLRRWKTRTTPVETWRASHRAEPVLRLYAKALRRLAARGHDRRPSETPHEFARRLAGYDVLGVEAFERLTELYVAARWGGRRIDDDVIRDLTRLLEDLGKPVAA